ncbi:integrase core domain-containing protein, partial [Gordonia amicalis]|uniref:integrase core domain-containing protein n=1 Tax=Gordonia amicalis TaxID=89053 RepID=UPI002953F7B0
EITLLTRRGSKFTRRQGVSFQAPSTTIAADAPKVVWALDFQFDSTVDGKKVKIASMVDEHTRMSLLNIVDRSIPADRLIEKLEKTFAIWGGPPVVLRMDNGPEFVSEALQGFCAGSVGICYIPLGTPWNNGFIESFNNRLRGECLNRICWPTLLDVRVVIEDFEDDHNSRPPALSAGLPNPGRVRSPMHPPTITPWAVRSTDDPNKELAPELPGSVTGTCHSQLSPQRACHLPLLWDRLDCHEDGTTLARY